MALDKNDLVKVLNGICENRDVYEILFEYAVNFLPTSSRLTAEDAQFNLFHKVLLDCAPELKGSNLTRIVKNAELEFDFDNGVSLVIMTDGGIQSAMVTGVDEEVAESKVPLIRAYDDPFFHELTPALSQLAENPSTARFLFNFLDARLLVENNNNISSMEEWVSKFFELGLCCKGVTVDSVNRWEDGSFTAHVKQLNAHGQMTSLFATASGWVPVIGSNIDVYLSDNLPVVEANFSKLFVGMDIHDAYDGLQRLLNGGTLASSLGLDCPSNWIEKISAYQTCLYVHFGSGVSLSLDLEKRVVGLIYCESHSSIWEA